MNINRFSNRKPLCTRSLVQEFLLEMHPFDFSSHYFCWLPAKAGGYHGWISFRPLHGPRFNSYLGVFSDYTTLEAILEEMNDEGTDLVRAHHRDEALLGASDRLRFEIPESDE